MKYGLINLSIIPLRLEPSDTSEMVSQALYGEYFKVIEQRKNWCKIRLSFDNYEGWIDHKQYTEITKEVFEILKNTQASYSSDIIDYITTSDHQLISIPMGSQVSSSKLLNHFFEGNAIAEKRIKSKIIETAILYINSPYLWGGKTPFGIDCSGYTQMVYKINGYQLLRDASEQATQGEVLSFIDESEPGDLAFFDNAEGAITHVGIILENHHIIHAHGKVRIDRLDQTGIFNIETKKHTHKLRVIKKII